MVISHNIPSRREPGNSVRHVSYLISMVEGLSCRDQSLFTSDVLGTLSQKTSIFKSPKFVCRVTDMMKDLDRTVVVDNAAAWGDVSGRCSDF